MMKRWMISFVRFYQRHASGQLGTMCKYQPTCSVYAIEALEKYGAIKGLALSVWRILRCNPFSKGGYDPLK